MILKLFRIAGRHEFYTLELCWQKGDFGQNCLYRQKIEFFENFCEDGLVAQSVYSTKYVVSDKLSSVYKIWAQTYNLGDMSQKWIFFDVEKSAKKADFGVFCTFLPFFWKNFKIFKITENFV